MKLKIAGNPKVNMYTATCTRLEATEQEVVSLQADSKALDWASPRS